ncbi:hypothetical protein NECAME_13537 [Necator americanus]|uniref:Uncharacterized protein n=1 Tax=Necator americanus TaxID=51031 RepID=W2SX35_NECAM|nr:hypothetical protein NECAME_13537 [Necator americanus]ETN73391.1 hypothetical protein NECAME_13537 [Necator americanus]
MPGASSVNRYVALRTSRYRAKMEKARREFIVGGPESAVTDHFRRSHEDVGSRLRRDFRGPLLQKFHGGEFKSKINVDNIPYARVEPSPYAQIEETNLDDVHRRSGSVVDYRQSRRDKAEENMNTIHLRSRSADYLMDKRCD